MVNRPRMEPSSRSLEDLVSGIDAAIASEASPNSSPDLARRTDTSDRYVAFSVGGILFAAAVPSVQEINRVPPITPVPNVPAWLLGVTNLRGDVVSVVDLRAFLDLEAVDARDSRRILVARSPITTCLVVDQVDGMVRIPRDQLQAPDAAGRDKASAFIRGFYHGADQLTTVLDIEKLLESPEMRQFD